MLLDVAARHADRTFLVDAGTGSSLTHAEAHARAGAIVAALQRKGLVPGDRVGLAFDNGVDLALLYLACLHGGFTAVPIASTLPLEERRYVVELAAPRIVLESMPELAADDVPASVEVDETRLFTITFTSGTTSRPKGIAQTAGAMLNAARSFGDELGYDADTRMLHVLPMTYMAGILNALLCPYVAGGSVVVDRAFDARSVLSFWAPVAKYAANTFWLAPTMIAALLKLDREPGGPGHAQAARAISIGTAPLAQSTRDEFESRYGAPLYESFGLSELLFVSTGSPRHPNPPGSVGRPLAGVELSSGDDGELLVHTPFAMAGYLGTDGLPVAPPEWFPTGDLGRVDNGGNLFVTGRKKDLIIRGGLNISPEAVEDALGSHPAVARVAVLGVPHELLGEEVVAVVELHAGSSLAEVEGALKSHAGELLAAAAVPTRFVEIDSFPVGPTGKIQKPELRARLFAH